MKIKYIPKYLFHKSSYLIRNKILNEGLKANIGASTLIHSGHKNLQLGVFLFDAKYLESLAGLPTAKSYLVTDCEKTFNTADALCSWFAEYKKERDSKKTAHKMRAGTKIVNTISDVLDTKNKIHHKDQHEM